MSTTPRPWSDHARLAEQTAAWQAHWSGRDLFRVSAGNDWIRLHLVGQDRPGLLLTDVPGALLAFAWCGPLPEAVHELLRPIRPHPLTSLLDGAHLERFGLLPDDRIVACRLRDRENRTVILLHQLFGARGNTVLIDQDSRLLWARHRPPHALLQTPPPAATWTTAAAGQAVPDLDRDPSETTSICPGDRLSAAALDHLTQVLAGRLGAELRGQLNRQVQAAERLVANLSTDLDRAERGDAFRDMAETLAAHLHELSQGAGSVDLPSGRSGEVLHIELDAALSPAANMEALFRAARKADKGRDIIAERLAEARDQARTLTDALTDLQHRLAGPAEDPTDPEAMLTDLLAWHTEHTDLLQRPASGTVRRGAHSPEQPARPFRRFLLADRWEVWVGRNNRENDELTHRAAHNRDIWLHAQGASGSHVILRTGGRPDQVPHRILQAAAALAAQHSKARHSALVPVIYTEQRYVRKPRKSPPGTAVCIREKSLFVAPGIPGNATTI